MHMTIKEGRNQVFGTHITESTLIINLRERWPHNARFDSDANEVVITHAIDQVATRLRVSSPIEVDRITIEKDQVVAYYRRLSE